MLDAENNAQKPIIKTSRLAIASFILGIVSFASFVSIDITEKINLFVAMIVSGFTGTIQSHEILSFETLRNICLSSAVLGSVLSIVSLRKIEKSKVKLEGKTFATIGLFISGGLLVFFVFGFLMICFFGFPTPD